MAKTAKSSFLSRVAEAHELHKADDTRIGSGGDLPAGIEHGIARLVDAKIGVYQKGDNEGEPFFMAAGTVLEPTSIAVVDPKTKKSKTIFVEGLRTQIGPEPLCDTTAQNGNQTSLADHWDRLLNHLRLLGIDTKTITPDMIILETADGKYESGPVLKALVEAGPTFRFRTWQGKATAQYPNPRVNHEWRGVCAWEPTAEDAVQDGTESSQPAKWEADAAKEQPPTQTTPQVEPAKESPPAAEPEVPDLLALAAIADNPTSPKKQSAEAAATIVEYAKAAGVDGYEAMASWTEVANAVITSQAPAEEAVAEAEEYSEEPEPWAPAKGEQAFFMNVKLKKLLQCEIVEAYPKVSKADIKVDGKLIKGVPFDKLAATEADAIPF